MCYSRCVDSSAMHQSIIRIINAGGTLIFAFVGLSMVIHRIYRIVVISPVVDRILLFAFSVIVICSAQRSVWLAFGLGLILLPWLYRTRSTLVAKMVVVIVMILVGLTMGIAFYPETGSPLVGKFAEIIDPSVDVENGGLTATTK
jgi:hypothetical protein